MVALPSNIAFKYQEYFHQIRKHCVETSKQSKYENDQFKTRQPIDFKDKTHQEQAHWTSWSPRIQKRR